MAKIRKTMAQKSWESVKKNVEKLPLGTGKLKQTVSIVQKRNKKQRDILKDLEM